VSGGGQALPLAIATALAQPDGQRAPREGGAVQRMAEARSKVRVGRVTGGGEERGASE